MGRFGRKVDLTFTSLTFRIPQPRNWVDWSPFAALNHFLLRGMREEHVFLEGGVHFGLKAEKKELSRNSGLRVAAVQAERFQTALAWLDR